MKIIFWISIFLVFYTYIGYGILLLMLVAFKQFFQRKKTAYLNKFPTLTVVVAAYNEEENIVQKIENTLSLNYPSDKLNFVFVTDGSTDSTPEKVNCYPQIKLLHSSERRGKVSAINRAMKEVTSEIAVFTDSNALLNKDALINIAKHYSDKKIGAVAGEKRVIITKISDATAGEGLYWKYESLLKKWDAELFTVVGAAGELFSIRTALYEPPQPDTILDDFAISMSVVKKGYRIAYEPSAYAVEEASLNTTEELKRKVRIAAGSIQSIGRLKFLLNPFRQPVLFFQYFSHCLLRWIFAPFLMILIFILNTIIFLQTKEDSYLVLWILQTAFYVLTFFGWFFESKQLRSKLFFVPFYFCFMNYAIIAGIYRYFFKKQSASWEKAKRKKYSAEIINT